MSFEENQRHWPFLRSFTVGELAIRAYVRCRVPAPTDADDRMQQLSVVLWKKFVDFSEGGDFRASDFGVAGFESLAWRRDIARGRLVLDNDEVRAMFGAGNPRQ